MSLEAPNRYWWIAAIIVPVAVALISILPAVLEKSEPRPLSAGEWRSLVEEVRAELRPPGTNGAGATSGDVAESGEPATHVFSDFEPEVQPSRRLKALLREFAADFEDQNWLAALDFFDPEHVNAQLDMYLNDDFMFGSLGTPGQRSRDTVIKLYFYETMQLYTSAESAEVIEEVRRIRFTGMSEEAPALWKVRFTAELEGGDALTGGFYVDKDTLRFAGAFG